MSCPILIHQFLPHLIGSNDRCPRLLNEDCNKQIRLSRAPEADPSIDSFLDITVSELHLLTTLGSKCTFQYLKVVGCKESASIIVSTRDFMILVDALYRERIFSQSPPNNHSDIIYFFYINFLIVPSFSLFSRSLELPNKFLPFFIRVPIILY